VRHRIYERQHEVVLWRISNHVSLTGDGGLRASGRWHTRGRRIVYCSESPAVVLLEILVHFEIDIPDLPVRYRLLKLLAPDEIAVEEVARHDLPAGWDERTDVTRSHGDRWLSAGRSALLRVPSAVVPEAFNLLLNPAHPNAGDVVLVQVSEHPIDPRLLR
jgi:RES domain-containing protein